MPFAFAFIISFELRRDQLQLTAISFFSLYLMNLVYQKWKILEQNLLYLEKISSLLTLEPLSSLEKDPQFDY